MDSNFPFILYYIFHSVHLFSDPENTIRYISNNILVDNTVSVEIRIPTVKVLSSALFQRN